MLYDDDNRFFLPPFEAHQAVTPLSEVFDWSVDFLGIRESWKETAGEGVKIAVLDTGCDLSHPDLQGQIIEDRDFTQSLFGSADRQGHGCVAPTDLVYTSLCGIQPIEEVFKRAGGIAHCLPDKSWVLDVSRRNMHTLSLDEHGNCVRSKILCVQKLPYDGPVHKVRTREGELTLTPWHPVYVRTSCRGREETISKKRADELKPGDRIVLARAGAGVTDEQVTLFLWHEWQCRFCGYNSRGCKSPQCHGCGKTGWTTGPSAVEIKLDEDLAYLAGLVASDGHLAKKTRQYQVSFTNNDAKQHKLFAELCERLFGVMPVRRAADSTSVECNCKRMWTALRAVGIPVGKKSKNLQLPELVAKSPRGVVCAFIGGLLEGDGNVRRRIRLATGSLEFATRLVYLCRTLGIRASYSQVPASKSPKRLAKNGGDSYSVRISAAAGIVSRIRTKDTDVVGPGKARRTAAVEAVAVEQYQGPMYDFTIEKYHNYVANGHIVSNTWCASMLVAAANNVGIRGIAYKAKVGVFKVLGDNGSGSEQSIAKGVQAAMAGDYDMISMSLGGPRMSAGLQRLLAEFVSQPHKFIFAAAGNDGQRGGDTIGYPARWMECISVAAVDKQGKRAPFSSMGPRIDIAAPGVDMLGAVPGGYATMSGTSMATPCACAVGALALAKHRKSGESRSSLDTVAQMREHLRKTAIPKGPNNEYGPGLINPADLLKGMGGTDQPVPPGDYKPIRLGRFGFSREELHGHSGLFLFYE